MNVKKTKSSKKIVLKITMSMTACGTSGVSNRLGILCGRFSSLGASREEWP